MTGVIGLGIGRVKADVCTLSKQVAEEDIEGWIEEQVYAMSTTEAMANINIQRHEV